MNIKIKNLNNFIYGNSASETEKLFDSEKNFHIKREKSIAE